MYRHQWFVDTVCQLASGDPQITSKSSSLFKQRISMMLLRHFEEHTLRTARIIKVDPYLLIQALCLETVHLDEFLACQSYALEEVGDVLTLVALQLDHLPVLRVLHYCTIARKLLLGHSHNLF